MADAMTECIRALVGRGVVGTRQLEVLLLLAQDPECTWSLRALAEGVDAAPERLAPVLHRLARSGLLSVALADPGEDGYRIDARLDIGALQALRTTFVRDRVRVTEALRRGTIAERRDSAPHASAWRSI
jgi:hypothetical protein